jgi:hypothetical protein
MLRSHRRRAEVLYRPFMYLRRWEVGDVLWWGRVAALRGLRKWSGLRLWMPEAGRIVTLEVSLPWLN